MYELAQVNVARMRGPLNSVQMHGFVAALDPVSRIAAQSPGFVWRLGTGHADVPVTRPDGDGASVLVVNVSVWTSYEALHEFVYRSVHGGFVRQRSRWFLPTPQPSTALWWVPAGRRPTADEALARLAVLRREGPSPRAFSLRRRFDADGSPVVSGRRGTRPPPPVASRARRRTP